MRIRTYTSLFTIAWFLVAKIESTEYTYYQRDKYIYVGTYILAYSASSLQMR